MKNNYDISDFVDVITESKTIDNLVTRFKKRRKELRMTQKQLATRSGVSYASIRRFESKGDISLVSLIKLANAIDCLSDFDALFKTAKILSLKELYNGNK